MKKGRNALVILLVLALLVPRVSGLDDGGTVMVQAALYGVTRKRTYTLCAQGGTRGRLEGTVVRILFFEVYNDVRFVPEDAE